jgi:uncharacterized membrane protein YdjX (TVP38/TMEM64 family)
VSQQPPRNPTSAPQRDAPAPPRRGLPRALTSPWLRLGVIAGLVVAAGVLAATADDLSVAAVREVVYELGPAAPVVYVVAYALATVLLLPGTPLTIAAGVLFGPATGSAVAWVGAVVGATASFLVGRLIGRRAVEQVAGRRVRSLDRFLSERGFVALLLVRLVPLFPFNVLNLVSGVTALRLRDYVFATGLGIVPGVVLLAAMGGSIDDPTSPVFLGALGGFVALTAVTGLVARRMRRRERLSEV